MKADIKMETFMDLYKANEKSLGENIYAATDDGAIYFVNAKELNKTMDCFHDMAEFFDQCIEEWDAEQKNYMEQPKEKPKVVELSVNRILKSGDRTIVFWSDGTKTIVKKMESEEDSPVDAFTAALAKKLFGSNSRLKKFVYNNLEYQEVKNA